MGKFNEYTQKATPADNDTMMIYDAAAKANKLSPFSGIWNWIVGKLPMQSSATCRRAIRRYWGRLMN